MFLSEQCNVLERLNPLITRHASRFALLRSDWWESPQEKCRDYISSQFEMLPCLLSGALQNARRLGLEHAFSGMLDLLEQQDDAQDNSSAAVAGSAYRVFRMLEAANDICLDQQGAPLFNADLTLICLILHTFCGESVAQVTDLETELQATSLFRRLPQNSGFRGLLARLAEARPQAQRNGQRSAVTVN